MIIEYSILPMISPYGVSKSTMTAAADYGGGGLA